MDRLTTFFILGYHGCEKEVGEAVLRGETVLKPSDNKWDWLGPGIYFWESDPKRGLAFAQEQKGRDKLIEPFVIGAVIDLGHCLNLMSQSSIQALLGAYESLRRVTQSKGLKMPENVGGDDKLMRHLDCAVIRHFHKIREDSGLPAYDSVRGLFQEDKPIYDNSGFKAKTHVQIAVCNRDCIKGFFRVQDRFLA